MRSEQAKTPVTKRMLLGMGITVGIGIAVTNLLITYQAGVGAFDKHLGEPAFTVVEIGAVVLLVGLVSLVLKYQPPMMR